MKLSRCRTVKQVDALEIDIPALKKLLDGSQVKMHDGSTAIVRVRDCDWAKTLRLTQAKWARLKRRFIKPPPPKTKRQIKKEKLLSTQEAVTDRAVMLEQVGLSLRQRAAFLNIPHLPTKLYNRTNLRLLYKRGGVAYKNVRLRNAPSATSRAKINRPADLIRLKR